MKRKVHLYCLHGLCKNNYIIIFSDFSNSGKKLDIFTKKFERVDDLGDRIEVTERNISEHLNKQSYTEFL